MRTGRFSNLVPLIVTALMALTTAGVGGGCITAKDPTLLNPAGPPDLKQVLVTERLSDGTTTDLQITYGTHPDLLDGATNKVMTGVVTKGAQQMHIVFDELLDGKTVEEFQCACTSNCPADHDWSIDPFDCSICGDDTGTPVNEAGHCLDAIGNVSDGLPDVSELQPGRVHLNCQSPTAFTYEVGPNDGFYNPSGDQLIPFGEGPAGLGPSLILTPLTYLPTNVDCSVVVDPSVHDKDGNPVPTAEVPVFHTEPLVLVGSAPQDNTTGIDASAAGFKISLTLNSFLDATAAASGITVQDTTAAAAVPGTVTVDTSSAGDPTTAVFTPTSTLASGHTFVVTIGTAVTDKFGDPLPAATTVTFKTK